ncbi:MAG: transposase [Balneolaceae bacterium]
MSNDSTSYTPEFKARVVLAVLSGEENTPAGIASEHGVTGEQILSWAEEMDLTLEQRQQISSAFHLSPEIEDSRNVDLESSDKIFLSEIEYGAAYDIYNYKRLTFWTVFGTGFVIAAIFALIGINRFSIDTTRQNVSEQSRFYQIEELRQRDQATLTSFGVVDPDEGIYRVPIDSIISRMADSSD